MRRGEVRWYTFRALDKRRPVLILTRDSALAFLHSVTVAPITTTIRDIPSEVYLTRDDGLLTECVANMDSLQTVPKSKVGALITTLSTARMIDVNRAVSFALGLDALTLWEEGVSLN
jgi:mRNA interferase MazF